MTRAAVRSSAFYALCVTVALDGVSDVALRATRSTLCDNFSKWLLGEISKLIQLGMIRVREAFVRSHDVSSLP